MAETEDGTGTLLRLTRKPRQALRLKREWAGGIVRTHRRVENAYGALPAGTLWLVLESRGGLHLLSLPCRCCRFQLHISRIGEKEVTYLGHAPGLDESPLSVYAARQAAAEWRVNGPEPRGDEAT